MDRFNLGREKGVAIEAKGFISLSVRQFSLFIVAAKELQDIKKEPRPNRPFPVDAIFYKMPFWFLAITLSLSFLLLSSF